MHFDAIQANPDVVLVAVADNDEASCAAAAERYSTNGYLDYTQMLDTERPNIVHICTPHYLHAQMAIACLERDINVLLEKPVATTVADARQLAAAANCSQAQVGICFQNRYNATARALYHALRSDRWGAVRGAAVSVTWFRDADYYRRRPWRGRWATAGGGALINQSIHTLDLLLWCLGDARDVRGRASTLFLDQDIEVEDTANLILTHPTGIRSVFLATNNYLVDAPVAIEIHTELATLRLDADLTVTHADGRHETIARENATPTGEKAYWGSSRGTLIDDFYRHVRNGEPFWIDATEATKTLSVITSIYAQSGATDPRFSLRASTYDEPATSVPLIP